MGAARASWRSPRQGAPPSAGRAAGAVRGRGCVPRARGRSPRRLDRLPDGQDDHPSLFDRSGENFVGLDNYETIFTEDTLQQALNNNLIWVLVIPMFVAALGLVFAVLTERVPLVRRAFKTVASCRWRSRFSQAGVIWRSCMSRIRRWGRLNASIGASVQDAVRAGGAPPRRLRRREGPKAREARRARSARTRRRRAR